MSIFGHEPTSREVVEANYTRMDKEIAALRAKVADHQQTIDAQLREAATLNETITALESRITALRAALSAHMALASKICYAEPELTEYRTLTAQARQALGKEGDK